MTPEDRAALVDRLRHNPILNVQSGRDNMAAADLIEAGGKRLALADAAPHDWEHCGLFDRAGHRYVQPAKCTCWKADYEAAEEAL